MPPKLEPRKKGIALLSDCCKLPFAYINKELEITAPHTKSGHVLKLTANDLRSLAALIDWTNGVRPPPERW